MINIDSLIPMSIEDLRIRKRKNRRSKRCLNLYFVDGLGEEWMLVESEIYKFGLDKKFPWYLKNNWGIKRINQFRRNNA